MRGGDDLLAPDKIDAAFAFLAPLYAKGQPIAAGTMLCQKVFRDPAGQQPGTQFANIRSTLSCGAQGCS